MPQGYKLHVSCFSWYISNGEGERDYATLRILPTERRDKAADYEKPQGAPALLTLWQWLRSIKVP